MAIQFSTAIRATFHLRGMRCAANIISHFRYKVGHGAYHTAANPEDGLMGLPSKFDHDWVETNPKLINKSGVLIPISSLFVPLTLENGSSVFPTASSNVDLLLTKIRDRGPQ